MKVTSNLLKVVSTVGFALTIAGLVLLTYPLIHKFASEQQAQGAIALLVLSSYIILPLGLALFVGGIVTLALRKHKSGKSESQPS